MSVCEQVRPCHLCPESGNCAFDEEQHMFWLLDQRLAAIHRRVLVLSNKGGVGKSTVTANLAASLARRGLRVGLLDADLSGPSQAHLFGLGGARLRESPAGVLPAEPQGGLKLVSSAFYLQEPDDAVMWRDSYKFQFLLSVLAGTAWGELDWLLVDMPPGTGGELIGLAQLLGRVDGAVIVTTPQQVAVMDARRAVTACREAEIAVLGIVENMSGTACPHCGGPVELFQAGGGERAAAALGVPFLGRIPLDHRVLQWAEEGRPAVLAEPGSPGALALEALAGLLIR
ncbi:MAG TPA: Mrp/NBP35 family ATP-binding protein [Symbiobacteriaceae bacterium]|jgi:Mrp family chromosome partitioning ATPase|nr:Mrp/NBP35 family ATP-binding protein [Symbiobacteriaceae bacterium]